MRAGAEASYGTWMRIESALGEQRMERYVWAQLVRTNPKATQRKLYDAYISRLKVLSAVNAGSMEQLVLAELSRFADELKLFLWIDDPDGTASTLEDDEGVLPQAILNLLREMYSWGSQVHLPLTLELLSRYVQGKASESSICKALQYILSFMVRRALCGIPTNNLNRIFTSLPVLLNERSSVDEQVAELLGSEQRYWPTDREVLERSVTSTTRTQLWRRSGQVPPDQPRGGSKRASFVTVWRGDFDTTSPADEAFAGVARLSSIQW